MFRKQLIEDLKDVFGFETVRITALDDETEVLFFNPENIVSTPIVGSGKTHFRVYGTLALNQDEANGVFGYLEHKLHSGNSPRRDCFQMVGDGQGMLIDLFDQHWIRSSLQIVWESDIDWNDAPHVEGGEINFQN